MGSRVVSDESQFPASPPETFGVRTSQARNATPERRRAFPTTEQLVPLITVFLAYFIAGKLGQATTNIRSGNLGPVWPASGIALAGVLAYGPRVWPGVLGAGTVHHVAFRAEDDTAQLAARNDLVAKGHNVSPQMDRDYFHSIYFREPGGVLFEIATDPPGFTVDEPIGSLGQSLKLPEWLETRRFEIEALLPNIRLPMEIPGPNA